MKEALLPTGIDVQSRKYHTEEDPRGTFDLFVSIHYYDIDIFDVLLHENSVGLSCNVYIQIDSDDYCVFVLNSYPNARIICEVCTTKFNVHVTEKCTIMYNCQYVYTSTIKIFKRQHLHPKYTWITYGWYAQASWINGDIVNCTEDQLKMVLENGISVEVYPIPNTATVAGLVRIILAQLILSS